MLVFPQWRPDLPGPGCISQRWMPAERFAPYVAKPVVIRPPPPPLAQIEDDDSSGDSSPERVESFEESTCGWRACDLRFPGIARLSAHVARVHALAHADGLFYCQWKGCARPQRGFNARYKMLVHIRTHTNERPHTCNQCNKSFSRAENLKIHLRSHSGEKPYVCPYEGCGKAYSNSSDRFKHTRTHTVDKPYCCKMTGCNKRYTDPSSLRKHVKTYKHFAIKERKDSEETTSEYSPLESNLSNQNVETSPLRATYSPSPYQVIPIPDKPISMPSYPQLLDQVAYLRPIEQAYPIRVPTHEMSYSEYAQMYEHAYRSHYHYPLLRQGLCDKVYYEEHQHHEVILRQSQDQDTDEYICVDEDMPLNLKCAKRMDIDDFVRRDLPLDLSTKS